MAEKKAGIRINALAKELGVESKAILHKLKEEGLGDSAPNHMSTISFGLAASVREWFQHSAGEAGAGTAIETAAPVEAAASKAKSRRKKQESGESEDPQGGNVAVAEPEAPQAPTAAPTRRPPVARSARTPAEDVEPVPADTLVDAPTSVTAVAPPAPEIVAPPVAPPAPIVEAPVASAPPAAPEAPPQAPPPTVTEAPHAAPPHAPPAAHPPRGSERSAPRPTITLANRGPGSTGTVERKPITPAPRLNTPAPAKIQGPRVVREEAPEVVPAPRARRPIGGGPPGQQESPGVTHARPQAGRGVRSVDDEGEDSDGKKKAGKGGASGRTLSSRRRGPDGRRGEAMEKLKEYTEADLIERRDRLNAAASYRTGFDAHIEKSGKKGTHAVAKSAMQRGEPIELEEPIIVKALAAALGVKAGDIIKKLMNQNLQVTLNQSISNEIAESITLEYGLELKIKQQATMDEILQAEFDARESDPANLRPRPPVVTILGHVDHGKTSLLDKIRSANVAAGESGGITQHTAAWMVTLGEGEKQKRVTFIDTPGHQAFTAMRARGANMTDVVVLVVSAAEGVQPQTTESINHARAAEVPIVVAMNKIDRPDANPDMILGQLAAQNMNPVEWGGDTEVVRTSATTGQGIPELIEILDYQAELLELKTDPTAPARGMVIESKVDPGMGSVATVLVQDGTLHIGDVVLCGAGYGRIRQIRNDRGESIPEASAAMPVIISGLSELPGSGEKFFVIDDFDRARQISEERSTRNRQAQLSTQSRVTADNLLATMAAGDVRTIHLIIKADVQGSVDTLVASVTGQNTSEVQVKVIHSGVGAINESDVQLAMATKINPESPSRPRDVAIIGFHVTVDESARQLAEQNHIDMKLYRVIYEIFDDLKKALSGMLEPEQREKLHGHVEVRQVFKVSRIGNIAGCLVIDGHIQRGSKIRLSRNGVIVTEDLSIESLKRLKDDAREVKSGLECGIKLANYDDIKVGDVMEAYVKETHQRTL